MAQFDALRHVPVMVIRGATPTSSAETVDSHARATHALESIEVPDQGHAPLLDGRGYNRAHWAVCAALRSHGSLAAIMTSKTPGVLRRGFSICQVAMRDQG